MTPRLLLPRRSLVRLALLFAVAQVVAVVGALFALPVLRDQPLGSALLVGLALVDLVLLALFAGWIIQGSVGRPMNRLTADVLRIADGDFHHRVGDPRRSELRGIQESVNRLADRLIADQSLLADNIRSLEETNRELVLVRDQVVQSARLASVGTLAAGIAHEVGNPLGAIMAYVDVARKRASQTGADTEILDSIRTEAGRIDRIVRGLLDYARSPDSEGGPAPVVEVLSRVRDLLETQGRLDEVDVTWAFDVGENELVEQPRRLEQVVVNLLLNALDALQDHERPRVAVRLHAAEGAAVRLPARREDDPPGINYLHRRRLDDESLANPVARADRLVVIEVSDNGPGIRPDDLEQVFDPFFTTKEPGKGTGLGLSICAQLVEGMGGRIDADHGPEGGARFTVRLPGTTPVEEATVGAGSEAPETA